MKNCSSLESTVLHTSSLSFSGSYSISSSSMSILSGSTASSLTSSSTKAGTCALSCEVLGSDRKEGPAVDVLATGAGTATECGATDGTGIPRLCRYASTNAMSWASVKASRLATMRLVIRGAGKEVKSKADRKAAEVVWEEVSLSNFIRLFSRGSMALEGRLRLSATVALRRFSSARAFSIRTACWLSASLICPEY